MKAERTGQYFHSFESGNIPNISWQEILKYKILLSPKELIPILLDAQEFLSTAEGPHQSKRIDFATEWFGWWSRRLEHLGRFGGEEIKLFRDKLCSIEDIRQVVGRLKNESLADVGLLNVAGAEGHAGHITAAYEMSGQVRAIWAFEQDSYFKHKIRPAPFLPLQVRLWMWCYSPISLLTVNPEAPDDVELNAHYQSLFNLTGADRCFADAIDPNCEAKIRRGKPGPGGYSDNKLHHILVASTLERVHYLRKHEEEQVEGVDMLDKIIRIFEVPQRMAGLSQGFVDATLDLGDDTMTDSYFPYLL